LYAAAPPAHAAGFGLEVSAAGSLPGGDDFEALNNAVRFEVIGSLITPSAFEVGVGTGIASHNIDGLAGDANAEVLSIFGEGRYGFGAANASIPHLHPFVAGRAGYARMNTQETLQDVDRNGYIIGGGGGLEYWFTDEVAAVGSAMLNYLSFEDAPEIQSESLSGTMTDLRAGLKVRF
jgi:hypothetical protein